MKVARRSNYRVVVAVPDFRFREDGERQHRVMMADGKQIADQVDRHCDGEGRAEVKFDVEYTCSHCGYGWEEDEDGVPVCCDEAQREAGAT